MALASTTRSPVVPLTLKSGSKTPHGAPRWDIAAVPTAWNRLRPTSNLRSESVTIQGVNVRRRVVPSVLSDLLVRVCRSKGLPRSANEPFPSLGSDEPLSKFDGGNHRFDIKFRGQEVGVDDGRIEWVQVP